MAKKVRWTEDEDNRLKVGVEQFSKSSYISGIKVSEEFVKPRTGEQCRERWQTDINPALKKGKSTNSLCIKIWLSALVLLLSQILSMTALFYFSMHTNNSSPLQADVTDLFEAKNTTVAEVGIVNQSINNDIGYEAEDIQEDLMVVEDVIINTEDYDQSIIEEEEWFFTAESQLEIFEEIISPLNMPQEQIQAEAVATVTRFIKETAILELDNSCKHSDTINIETLKTDIENIATSFETSRDQRDNVEREDFAVAAEENDLERVDMEIEKVIITEDDEQLIIEKVPFTPEYYHSAAQTATNFDANESLCAACIESLDAEENDKETNQLHSVLGYSHYALQEKFDNIAHEIVIALSYTVIEDQKLSGDRIDTGVDILTAEVNLDISHPYQQHLEQEDAVAAVKEQENRSIEEVLREVTDSVHTAAANHGWHRIATSSSAHLHNHSEHTLTSSHNMHDDFTWKNDLALGARGTKIDVSGLAVTAAPSNKKENAVTKFLMQPLKMLNKQGSSKKLNSNKPIKDMFTSCVYFNHQAANGANNNKAIVVRLKKAASVSSIAITHLLPSTTMTAMEQEGEGGGCSGVKDFSVHNMDTVNIVSYANQIGDITFSYDDTSTLRTEVTGGTIIKHVFQLPSITPMKKIGFSLRSLQDETASIGCLCRVHVYGEFPEDEKKRQIRGERKEPDLWI